MDEEAPNPEAAAKPTRKKRPHSGQFKKGNKVRRKLPPVEDSPPHPTIPYRDIYGRVLPGTTPWIMEGADPNRLPKIGVLKQRLLDAVTPFMITKVIKQLFAMCLDPKVNDPDRLKAIELFFNRVLGRAEQNKNVKLEEKKTIVNYDVAAFRQDLQQLSDQELQKASELLIQQPKEVPQLDGQEVAVQVAEQEVQEVPPEANGQVTAG